MGETEENTESKTRETPTERSLSQCAGFCANQPENCNTMSLWCGGCPVCRRLKETEENTGSVPEEEVRKLWGGYLATPIVGPKLSPAVVKKMLTAKPDSTGPEEEERRLWGFQEFQQFQQFQQMAAKLSPAVVEKMLTAKPDSTGPEEEERRLWGFQEFQQFQQFQQMAAKLSPAV